jgi:hypothetical protein
MIASKISGFFRFVESERELIEEQRQILFRHVVVVAGDAALEQQPKRFDALSVNATGTYWC